MQNHTHSLALTHPHTHTHTHTHMVGTLTQPAERGDMTPLTLVSLSAAPDNPVRMRSLPIRRFLASSLPAGGKTESRLQTGLVWHPERTFIT